VERIVGLFKVFYCRYTGEGAVGHDHHVSKKLLKISGGPEVAAPDAFVTGTELVEFGSIDLRK
jgi:hypothetical protein